MSGDSAALVSMHAELPQLNHQIFPMLIFQASYDKQQDGSEKQWSLSSELQTPTKGLSGSAVMVFDPKNKVTMNISINNLLESPVVLNCEYIERVMCCLSPLLSTTLYSALD